MPAIFFRPDPYRFCSHIWLQNNTLQFIHHQRSRIQNLNHQASAHTGDGHDIHFARLYYRQPISKPCADNIRYAVIHHIFLCQRQRLGIDITGKHFNSLSFLRKIARQKPMIRANIRYTSPLRHKISNRLQSL